MDEIYGSVLDNILAYQDYFEHVGVSKLDGAPIGSGRYPLGSGPNAYQRPKNFAERVYHLRNQGMSDDEIAKAVGLRSKVALADQIRLYENEQKHPEIPQMRGLMAEGVTADEFVRYVSTLKKRGLSEREIAVSVNLYDSEDLRTQYSVATNFIKNRDYQKIKEMKDSGMTATEIAKELGYNSESSVRSILNSGQNDKLAPVKATADFLKERLEQEGYIDVSSGTNKDLGVTANRFNQALYLLELEGYPVYARGVEQVTNPTQQTNTKILCPPGTEYKDVYKIDLADVKPAKSEDKILTENGEVVRKAFEYPSSMDSSRLAIRYGDEGGSDKDGVIEIRRGVKDLDLGNSHYAQVRILVDETHYLKGMAMYSDDIPEGKDVLFNTGKKSGTAVKDVLKEIKDDPENPFGALIKEHGGQSYYDDPDGQFIDPRTGNRQSLSLINKKSEEGDWNDWSKTVPSQMLAKQNIGLIKSQLKLSEDDRQAEFDDIMQITNPSVKKYFLNEFASSCDSTAQELEAMSFPRQRYQVLLPCTSLKDNEIFAPNYNDGETVACIRFPHEGIYEIPIVTVNNKNEEGRKTIGINAKDAIGLNSHNASIMSGADFDGDTVLVIPVTDKVNITNHPQLSKLTNFETKQYQYDDVKTDSNGTKHYYRQGKEFKPMTEDYKQKQMGMATNLIADMTVKGAPWDDIAEATKYSMVVIDAVKHKLDYNQCAKDTGYQELRKKYLSHTTEEGKESTGASTILTRAKNQQDVVKRQGAPKINQKGKSWYDPDRPEGALIYKEADDAYYVDKKTGKTKTRKQHSTQMAETDDAYKLVSDYRTPTEIAYADYANFMKGLANRARLESVQTQGQQYNKSAAKVYSDEVKSLNDKLALSESNVTNERYAQRIANSRVAAKVQAWKDDGLSSKEIKKEESKERQRQLAKARTETGAKRHTIEITDKEMEAIQAGAVNKTTLDRILKYADKDDVRTRVMPQKSNELSSYKQERIRTYAKMDYSNADIAQMLGVSVSTVLKYLPNE